MSDNVKLLIKTVALLLFVGFSSGCATTQRAYYWGNYENTLYGLYKGSVSRTEYAEGLNNIVAEGEKTGKVPPGLYAECGFAFYEIGDKEQAINFFQKEHEKWPESRYVMEKMIRNSQLQN